MFCPKCWSNVSECSCPNIARKVRESEKNTEHGFGHDLSAGWCFGCDLPVDICTCIWGRDDVGLDLDDYKEERL